ncbi:MAG: hypothetical protein H6Q68_1817 [Firmicutes bacterium]|nr:hypothetical protein [Bacillota bacterium]
MRQQGVTLLELVICIGVFGIIASTAIPKLGQSLARQELDGASQQLAADIRWLQQVSINLGSGTTSYIMKLNCSEPYGYDVTNQTQVIKKVTFPSSVMLSSSSSIIFGLSGAPLIGQTVMLKSIKLNTKKYVILAPVTGRVRISDFAPWQAEE